MLADNASHLFKEHSSGDKMQNNSPTLKRTMLLVLVKKKPYHYVVGFADEILQLTGG